MAYAILGHLCIFRRIPACLRSQEPIDIIVVPRYALPSSLQLATAVPPPAQAMQDNNLVPEGATGVNGRHVADCKIKVRKIVRDIRPDYDRSMRVERGLRAR